VFGEVEKGNKSIFEKGIWEIWWKGREKKKENRGVGGIGIGSVIKYLCIENR